MIRGQRRFKRESKAWRRLKADRAQHGQFQCPCKSTPGTREFGKAFARFADTPQPCSCRVCGNPRRHEHGDDKLTRAERRAALDFYESDRAALSRL